LYQRKKKISWLI